MSTSEDAAKSLKLKYLRVWVFLRKL